MKTKEQILGPIGYSHDAGDFVSVDDSLRAMQEYADQQLEAYKAKLKAKLDAKLSVSKSDLSDHMMMDFLQIINTTTP